MRARLLLDTNVLIYPHDPSEPLKQREAARILRRVYRSGAGCVSTQILSEYYSVMTTKLRPRASPDSALASLEHQVILWPVLQVTTEVVLEAARAAHAYRISFWDAQLWAIASVNRVECILTEGLQHGSTLGGVRILNPFRSGRHLDELLP